jgi:D-3-phosphoglycerate dehydrogenase / 2-oxoglutarate reductase
MKQVLIAAPITETFRQFLHDHAYECIEITTSAAFEQLTSTTVSGIITSNKIKLHSGALQRFPNLKWIGRMGSGMEIIDTDYCQAHGIHFFSSPQGIANAVAEHMMGMLLSLLHHIPRSFSEIQQGKWLREPNRGIELSGLTVGIIGYGHTGSAFADKLKSFVSEVLVYDKYKQGFRNDFVRACSLKELQVSCDIISFHVPLTDETMHYYNQQFLHAMHKPHFLLNASRGQVVDTSAVLYGLQQHQIRGVCLDVLEEEAKIETVLNQKDNIIQALLQYPVVLTPHIAGYTYDASEKMSAELMMQLQQIV